MAKDPYKYFRVEARELLAQLARGGLELEKAGGGSAADVARLLRHAHTLKGAARVVRQREIAEDTHAIEEVLAPYRDVGGVPREQVDAVLARVDAIGGRVAGLGEGEVAPSTSPSPSTTTSTSTTTSVATGVRAELGELDGLMEGLAEMHVQLEGLRKNVSGTALLQVEQMGRELRLARDAAEQLRLVTAAAVFTPLERSARDEARALGKVVRVTTRGGELRLDAQVLDGVLPALVQAVRNAVAHGIEREGSIAIEVARRGAHLVFTVRDDGRGVDVEAVRRAALKRGVDAAAMGRDELLRLLLRGGITTVTAVSGAAGRGIGLDVVREVAERLGGVAMLTSDRGTTLELRLPMSLAAVESLVVESAGTTATIPLEAVRRTVRVTPDDLEVTEHGLSVVHEGQVVPFLPLPRALRQPMPTAVRARRWAAVIVEAGGRAVAVGVDRLRGTATVVLRPLPLLAPADAVIAGASLDVDGAPQLALDPAGLVDAAARGGAPDHTPVTSRLPVLVVDDSLTTRMLEQSILETAGWEADLASSGEEGLAMARARDYALFLVDVEMPGIDGFAFIEQVRADAALRHIPAVLVTSRDAPEDRKRGREVGAQGHVVKSEFDQVALCALIDRLVRR